MEQLHTYREKLRQRISLLRQEIETAGVNGGVLSSSGEEDDLHELVSILNRLIAEQGFRLKVPQSNAGDTRSDNARWVWNPLDNSMSVTSGLLKLFGIDGQSQESNLHDILKPVFHSDREKVHTALQQSYAEGKPFNIYYRITTPDNALKFVHSRGKIVKDPSGNRRMIGTVKDVTGQVIDENKFHILLDTSPDAIITTDIKGCIKDWNHTATGYFGRTHSQAKGKNFAELILAEEHRQPFSLMIEQYLAEKGASLVNRKTEIKAIRHDGSMFPAELTISAVRQDSSHLLLLFIRDISEQKIGENLLREKDELYKTVVESLFEGLIITDTSDRITYVNSQFEKLSGYEKHEVIGKVEYEIFHPPSLHESIRNRMKKRLQGQGETYELQFTKKDGSVFTARVNAAPFRNASGAIIGTVGAITDITSQKLEAELEQLVIAATKSFNSVVISDRHGLIEWINEGYTKLSGYTLEDVKGTKGEILNRAEDSGLANQEQLLEEVQKRKEPVTFERKSYSKAGTEFWTITTLTPVLNDANEVEKIISIDSDITLRKKMEEQLKLANRIAENSLIKGNRALSELTLAKQTLEETMRGKEQFLAHISHEIRTPMNGIIGLTDILLKTNLDHEQREYLEAIKKSGDTLMVVINDILDLSKIEAGKMTFEEIPLKIGTIISQVMSLFTPKAREKGILLTKKISDKIPEVVLGDPVRLNQIIMNLVSNAVKFTDKGYVEISAEAETRNEKEITIAIKVTDTGPGIPQENLHTLFMDFTQMSADITRKYGGTGLGLSIAKRLVELQHGSVAVSSRIGAGSEFVITMPFTLPSEEVVITDKEEISEYSEKDALKGVKVLLVEDHPVNQLMAEKLLSDWGCEVTIAENGKIALEKIVKADFDIVLMDIKMPVMDGYEATRNIRQMTGKLRTLPIVALTAHAAMWEGEKCIEAGMNGYISKPYNTKELYRMIAGNLNNSDLNDKSNTAGQPGDGTKFTDLTFLKSIAKGSNEFMNKIINSFIIQTTQEIKNMQGALAKKDWTGVHAAAHKIKPSLHFVGITQLKDPILAVEKNAKELTNLESVPALVNKIVDICNLAMAELKVELDNINKG